MKIFIVSFLMAVSSRVFATDLKAFTITVKDGKFSPDQVIVPKEEKFKLIVKNEGNAAEEFESAELNRERVVVPHQSVAIILGPLSSGEYGFFGDFHPDTAKGKVIVK